MAMTSESTTTPQSATEPTTTRANARAPGDEAVGDPGSTQAAAGHAETDAATGALASERVAPRPARTGATKDPRFHIFVIDTGWNCAASKVLRDHLNMISDLHIDDELYVLDRATSIALLRYYPLQVGRDPIIAVHDLRPRHRHRVKHTHGFRMHLGILDTEEQVLTALRMFARFLITHRNAADVDQLVRQHLHRQGLAGAIEILGGHEHGKMIE
jgi:hypothetical protein